MKTSEIDKITKALIQSRLQNLKSVVKSEHALESVAEINGVEYVNDSKSTNLETAIYALEMMDKPTIWIMEAGEMELNYNPVLPWVGEIVDTIVVYGVQRNNVVKVFQKHVNCVEEIENIELAVKWSFEKAKTGSVVLFSPTTPSVAQFKNYQQRGDYFKNLVLDLIE